MPPPEKALRQVADPARYNKVAAVRAMLRRGFPVTALSQHGAMPVRWAAFHGNLDMIESVLRHYPAINARDRQIDGTAMDWVIHGALNPWGISTGQHHERAPATRRGCKSTRRHCQPLTMLSIRCCASISRAPESVGA
jgi:hypothetical protein